MDNNNTIERLKNFVLAHPEMSRNGFIQGFDKTNNKIIILVNGEKKYITIDELESGHLNNNVTANVNEKPIAPPKEEIEVMEELSVDQKPEVIESLDEPVISQNTVKELMTLKDIKEAVYAKDEASLNKALEKFAIDEKNNSINMNKAIKIVTDNSINSVVSSVKENTLLPSDLNSYDITGKIITPVLNSQEKVDVQSLIDQSFNNILVYVEAAKLKNIMFTDKQIQNAKVKYATEVHDKLNVLGLNKPTAPTTNNVANNNVVDMKEFKEQKQEENNNLTLGLKPDTDIKKAGFADILVLAIIIIIYVAIIINLITKLK